MILLDGVSKAYGGRTALAPTTLEFARGATTAVIGPSGCGKSTLLRLIVGLVRPDSGRVCIDGRALDYGAIERVRHGIGYVIQDGGLFPHLSARDNVALLARHLRLAPAHIAARISQLSDLFGISESELARHPEQLSGGQRQRVGFMRALMLDPPLLLLDEPLGALDPVTRHGLQDELKRVFRALAKTVVLVTHDMGEAGYLAEDIVLMRQGRVLQRGGLRELLQRPAEPYVSAFLSAHRTPGAAS